MDVGIAAGGKLQAGALVAAEQTSIDDGIVMHQEGAARVKAAITAATVRVRKPAARPRPTSAKTAAGREFPLAHVRPDAMLNYVHSRKPIGWKS